MQSIDLTGVIIAGINGLFGVLGLVFLYWLQQHIKDKQAAAVIEAALDNALGAMKQASDASVTALHPTFAVAGVPPKMIVGVQYVLDHAEPELARWTNITPAVIADKLNARLGKKSIEANVHAGIQPMAANEPPISSMVADDHHPSWAMPPFKGTIPP